MKKITIFTALALVSLAGCGISESKTGDAARDRQTQAIDTLADQADRAVGLPAISNFEQKKMVRDIYERTDRATTTFAYVQGMDGRLTCLGRAVGYGVPYGTRATPPEDIVTPGLSERGTVTVAQPEPNGVYLPDNAAATWLQVVNPANGKVDVIYIEPNVVVSPFRLSGPAVAADCPA